MKTFSSITFVVLLPLSASSSQAQTTQPKLNQLELLQQFIGSWKSEIGKDTTRFWDAKSYGTGLECNYKSMTKGQIIAEGKELYGYDKNIDKSLDAVLYKGKDIAIYTLWFISKSKYIMFPYSDMSNSEIATLKVEGEFRSPDMIVETITVNNKQIRIDTWTRVKK
jgi:hypothetical protein